MKKTLTPAQVEMAIVKKLVKAPAKLNYINSLVAGLIEKPESLEAFKIALEIADIIKDLSEPEKRKAMAGALITFRRYDAVAQWEALLATR